MPCEPVAIRAQVGALAGAAREGADDRRKLHPVYGPEENTVPVAIVLEVACALARWDRDREVSWAVVLNEVERHVLGRQVDPGTAIPEGELPAHGKLFPIHVDGRLCGEGRELHRGPEAEGIDADVSVLNLPDHIHYAVGSDRNIVELVVAGRIRHLRHVVGRDVVKKIL